MYTYITVHCRSIPLLSAFSFLIPFCSPFVSHYLLGTLLAVIGSRPPRSQVARKLIFPFPSPYPYTPHSKIPTPGSPRSKYTFIRTTSRTWLTRSSTCLSHLPLSFCRQDVLYLICTVFETVNILSATFVLKVGCVICHCCFVGKSFNRPLLFL
jgi:hypothetical protein